jgi:murein L,D-transpeptidase YafK
MRMTDRRGRRILKGVPDLTYSPTAWRATILSGALLLAALAPVNAQLSRELGLDAPDSVVVRPPPILPTESSFALSQLRNQRVMDARVATRFQIKRLFHERGIRYPAADVFMRIFKRERSLELWVRPEGGDEFALLKTYAICALAGELGPKRLQGDAQVPEGFYFIDFFNPRSEFHLSLHLDYPNRRDRLTGLEGTNLGGDIFIHGGCNSDGCLAVTDDGIRELYWVAVEARAAGQDRIPVHIFPARLEDEDFDLLLNAFRDSPGLGHFWQSLKPGYDFFEQNRRVPFVAVDESGYYRVNGVMADFSAPPPATAEQKAARPAPAPRAGPPPPLGTPVSGARQPPDPDGGP